MYFPCSIAESCIKAHPQILLDQNREKDRNTLIEQSFILTKQSPRFHVTALLGYLVLYALFLSVQVKLQKKIHVTSTIPGITPGNI